MTLKNKVDQFVSDSDIAHQIVHGPRGETIPTEGGPVPTFATVLGDISQVNERLAAVEAGQSSGGIGESTWERLITAEPGLSQPIGAVAEIPSSTDDGYHVDPIKPGNQIVSNAGRFVRRSSAADGWEWLREDSLGTKADNLTIASTGGSLAVLATDSGDVLIALDASGRRRIPDLSMSDGLEMSVRDDLDIKGIDQVTMQNGMVTGYRHALGAVVDFTIPTQPDDAPEANVLSCAAHDRKRITGAAYNQWIYPTFCSMLGRQWLGSVGQGNASPEWFGGLSVNEKIGQASWMQYEFDRQQFLQSGYQTDDHNGPAVLLDPRPNARHPLLVFQADHSGEGSRFRCWRSRTVNAAGIGDVRTVSMTGNMSYAQAHRNPLDPDEIIVFSRQGGSSSAVWMLFRSKDEMDSVHGAPIIGGDDLYMMTRPSMDGSGLHIGIQQHPQNGADQRVLYLKYRFSDRSLRNLAGDVVAADVFTKGAFDPFSTAGPTTVYSPPVGRKKRLFDMLETAPGVIEFVVVDFIDTGVKAGTFKHIRMDAGSKVVSQIGSADAAGHPIEASPNSYYGGIALTGSYGAVAAVWNRVTGVGGLYRLTSTTGGDSWTQVLIEASDGADDKIIRPVMLTEFHWSGSRITWALKPKFVFLRGSYQIYLNFNLDAQEASL